MDELFQGQLPIREAIRRLRTRLLELSARNRLLNYKHPKGRSLQFVDKPDLDLLFERLTDSKSVPLAYVPEPAATEYERGKKPEVRQYARELGIDTSFEFPAPRNNGGNYRRLQPLRALFYPPELEKSLRKVAAEAKTVIEETGSNMLYLMFGFLEFYESEDSDRPLLAPLLSVPVVLTKGEIDPQSRTYQYALSHSGEDIAENHTLREKLRQDFRMQLPDLEEEDTPESYFTAISKAIRTKSRWKVRRQLTLGYLSFGKLAIWADLDPDKWPGLLEHPVLKRIFEGSGNNGGGGFHAEDYDIDRHPQSTLQLIYDADSSQHSALIDVLSGKDMVINGPPGTGKSQTITNIIATALVAGKKVLFVSEKLAALEVVRARLEKAKLGYFCLELHSHKTQKKKLVEDIKARIDQRFPPQPQAKEKLGALLNQKKQLNRYAELMASQLGNLLGKSVHEVFWAAERRRQELGDLAERIARIGLAEAPCWNFERLDDLRGTVEAMAQLYAEIGSFTEENPWWGFSPRLLSPGDEIAVLETISACIEHADHMAAQVRAYVALVGDDEHPAGHILQKLNQALQTLREPPSDIIGELLPRFFPNEDARGQRSSRALHLLYRELGRARERFDKAGAVLHTHTDLTGSDVETAWQVANSVLTPAAFGQPVPIWQAQAARIADAAAHFGHAHTTTAAPHGDIQRASLDGLRSRLEKLASYNLSETSLKEIDVAQRAVFSRCRQLSDALERITDIAKRRSLPFDGTPAMISTLAGVDAVPDILPGVRADDSVMAEASRLAHGPYSGFALNELQAKAEALRRLHGETRAALGEISAVAQRIGLRFADTEEGLHDFAALIDIARSAPQELLGYRQASFASPRFAELAARAEEAKTSESDMRTRLEPLFYLDALPDIADIDHAVRVFRRGDGLFNIFSAEWRAAKRLFRSLAKEKAKRSAAECERTLSELSQWIKHRDKFEDNRDHREALGDLFQGLDTDFEKIRRLHSWYRECRSLLDARPELCAQINLTQVDAGQLAQVAARADMLVRAMETVAGAQRRAGEILAVSVGGALAGTPPTQSALLAFIEGATQQLLAPIEFFSRLVRPSVSPFRGIELLQARAELAAASPDLQLLLAGSDGLVAAGGRVLEGLRELPRSNWRGYLDQVHTLCVNAQVLVDYLKEYVTLAVTPSQAECFMEAKLSLDTAVAGFGSSGWAARAADWTEHTRLAIEVSDALKGLAETLQGHGAEEASVSALVDAIRFRDEGRQIVAALNVDSDNRALFGEFLLGERSDLERFSGTHKWGTEVVALGDTLPTALRQALLSMIAPEVLQKARAIVGKAVASYEATRAELNKLTEYGPLDWDHWQASARPHDASDYADDIKFRLEIARDGIGGLIGWSKYLSKKDESAKAGLGGLVAAMEAKHLPASMMGAAFEFLTYQSIAKSIYKSHPELARFSGNAHEQLRKDFLDLDKKIISLTGREFANSIDKAKRVPDGTTGVRATDYSDMALVRRELNKTRRHIPIRQLVKRAGRALQELKPCFMMGPLSVAQYLEPGSIEFDLVVMDEASQLRPEDALGAVARGKQLVVVGDPKQLPPTSFFDRLMDSDDEDGEEAPTVVSGMESILDICQQLFHPARTLRWHYRSQHESLIAFSNHRFYNRNLIVFPSPYNRTRLLGVNYRHVRTGVYQDRRNLPEAQRVVDAVLEHMVKRPEESLGVVTLNQTQREVIEELLDRKLREFEEGSAFLERHEGEGWPFFVKNLENVQGDERDVIFISTTFGKAPGTDKVRQNFGPISRPDGWRRLNVLFTRARKRVELFTSMRPEDIVLDEATPEGTKALREYLDFAEQGVLTETGLTDREPDSDFEIAVGNVLTQNAYQICYQLGVAGYFIDIAVRNPDRPGEFIAGIECDGATYHSSFSARDRDRIRQEILESLGWRGRIHRIWSTDWFAEPQKQTKKLLAFLEQRRLASASQEEETCLVEEDWLESVEADEQRTEAAQIVAQPDIDGGDEFVEVGDRVTYCFLDRPGDRHTVLIVDSESNPKLNILNENTPVARTLLGLCTGEENALHVPGQMPRMLKVVKIHRDSDELMIRRHV